MVDMPAMATPYVVPKVPLSKNTLSTDISSSIPQPGLSSNPCCTASTYNWNEWCEVCHVQETAASRNGHSPAKKYYEPGPLCTSETVCSRDPSLLKYDTRKNSQLKNERVCSDSCRNQLTSKANHSPERHSPKKLCAPVSSKKLPALPPVNENVPNEKYLREAERVLRGKLRDLKCTPPPGRQLPEVPRNPAGGDRKPISRSVVKALRDIADSSCNSAAETKRGRHVPEPDLKPSTAHNTPKRPRDDSPKNKVCKDNDTPSAPLKTFKKEVWVEPAGQASSSAHLKKSSSPPKVLPRNKEDLSTSSESENEDDNETDTGKRGSSDSGGLHTTIHHPRHTTASLLRHLPHVVIEDKKLHPSLRPSLFSHIPPFIKFVSDSVKVDKALPIAVQRALKWKLTTITPIIVKKVVQNSGFKFTRRTPDWVGVWGKQMKSIVFRTLKDHQKLNHFPGTFHIGRKDRLWRNLQRCMHKYGKKEFGFMPRTYVLPQDQRTLRAIWDKQDSVRWIVKPPASARGAGIKVVNKWSDVPKKVPLVVQKYISNPYLINGSKFDLRLYVLVTSFDPLRIYIYENGLVRFASAKYTDDMKTLNDRFIHLTNYSINKFSNSYSSNDDASACLGHKWTLRSLWSFLSGSVNIDDLWSSLVDLVIKTIICGESPISNLTRANLTSRYCCYELFGIDVLLDENLKPWLLEVNISPSLHSGSSLDTAVKGPLVTNVLNLVGYHIPDTLNQNQKTDSCSKMGVEGPLTIDQRLYVMQLSPQEKEKHDYYSSMQDRDMYLDDILQELTPDDVRYLIQYEDEITQTGSFQKIFPTDQTFAYHKFMEGHCYYNRLLDAWEYRYGRKREDGIALLRSLCDKEVHLDVSGIEPRTSISLNDDIPSQLAPGSSETPESQSSSATEAARKSKAEKRRDVPRGQPRRSGRLSALHLRWVQSYTGRLRRRIKCKPANTKLPK